MRVKERLRHRLELLRRVTRIYCMLSHCAAVPGALKQSTSVCFTCPVVWHLIGGQRLGKLESARTCGPVPRHSDGTRWEASADVSVRSTGVSGCTGASVAVSCNCKMLHSLRAGFRSNVHDETQPRSDDVLTESRLLASVCRDGRFLLHRRVWCCFDSSPLVT